MFDSHYRINIWSQTDCSTSHALQALWIISVLFAATLSVDLPSLGSICGWFGLTLDVRCICTYSLTFSPCTFGIEMYRVYSGSTWSDAQQHFRMPPIFVFATCWKVVWFDILMEYNRSDWTIQHQSRSLWTYSIWCSPSLFVNLNLNCSCLRKITFPSICCIQLHHTYQPVAQSLCLYDILLMYMHRTSYIQPSHCLICILCSICVRECRHNMSSGFWSYCFVCPANHPRIFGRRVKSKSKWKTVKSFPTRTFSLTSEAQFRIQQFQRRPKAWTPNRFDTLWNIPVTVILI